MADEMWNGLFYSQHSLSMPLKSKLQILLAKYALLLLLSVSS